AGALDLGAHRHVVVFADEDGGELPEAGDVEGFVEGALIDGTVSEEGEADAAGLFVPAGEGCAGAEGDLSADDSVAAEVADVGLKIMHRAPFAFGATVGSSEEFGHGDTGFHAEGEGMAVIAVAIDEIVLALLVDRCDADGDGFLAGIEVAETADPLTGFGVFLV